MQAPADTMSYPAKDYRVSRMIRLGLFSLIVAVMAVSIAVVSFRWLWDTIAATGLGRGKYNIIFEIVLPAMIAVAFLLFRVIKDASDGVAKKKGA